MWLHLLQDSKKVINKLKYQNKITQDITNYKILEIALIMQYIVEINYR